MASKTVDLNSATYVAVAVGEKTVSMFLPGYDVRQLGDRVLFQLGSAIPTSDKASAVLYENHPFLLGLSVPTGETLYARWAGRDDAELPQADRYVVVIE